MTTQYTIDQLADRIERAYRRQHPNWLATGLTPGVWAAAAVRLGEVTVFSPNLPVDPELFVSVQSFDTFRRDPWQELTQEGSAQLYRTALRRIIRQLKRELATELRWSARWFDAGHSLDDLIAGNHPRVSPISKLVLCNRQARPDLAATVRAAAEAQHLACPLYRPACRQLISAAAYPYPDTHRITTQGVSNQNRSYAWN